MKRFFNTLSMAIVLIMLISCGKSSKSETEARQAGANKKVNISTILNIGETRKVELFMPLNSIYDINSYSKSNSGTVTHEITNALRPRPVLTITGVKMGDEVVSVNMQKTDGSKVTKTIGIKVLSQNSNPDIVGGTGGTGGTGETGTGGTNPPTPPTGKVDDPNACLDNDAKWQTMEDDFGGSLAGQYSSNGGVFLRSNQHNTTYNSDIKLYYPAITNPDVSGNDPSTQITFADQTLIDNLPIRFTLGFVSTALGFGKNFYVKVHGKYCYQGFMPTSITAVPNLNLKWVTRRGL